VENLTGEAVLVAPRTVLGGSKQGYERLWRSRPEQGAQPKDAAL